MDAIPVYRYTGQWLSSDVSRAVLQAILKQAADNQRGQAGAEKAAH